MTQGPDDPSTLVNWNKLPPQGPETFGTTPEGQRLYLTSYFQNMHRVPGMIGVVYWDPLLVHEPDISGSCYDTALFDRENRALPALRAFGEKYR